MERADYGIVVVDDQPMCTQALQWLIKRSVGLSSLGVAHDGDEGCRLVLETRPDMAVLGTELPGRGAFEIAEEIESRLQRTRILFLASYVCDALLERAMRVGARGYLLRTESMESVIDAIRNVGAGGQGFSDEARDRLTFDPVSREFTLPETSELGSLSNRQLEILCQLAIGRTVKEIARTMHVSDKAIDSQKYRIMSRLGIHDRVELARYAIREGLTLP